jgi:hypothetical protein
MTRLAILALVAVLLAACQTTSEEPPYIPPDASRMQENAILCSLPRNNPNWVPCGTGRN